MKYEFAPDIQKTAEEISVLLFPHIKIKRVRCFRSYGTSSRGTVARCHGIGKLIQKAMNIPAFYVLEFLSERFDKLNQEEKLKIIIHELMHIPASFGGGFRHHNYICDKKLKKNYRIYSEHKIKNKEVPRR
jgi:predicted metallopeptidase